MSKKDKGVDPREKRASWIRETPLAYGFLTKEQFDAEIEKGMADIREGRVYSADAVEAEMKRDYGI